ncbi:hypothetical protein SEVIR_2G163300v4 [Setaria viridis]|uniref:DUF4220 domain-containing protein n=1 Tax=Setaria viridis TaxID=4556 RepID=A0A4U6VTP4_SETVI|nr:uncharacterized protein LOC117846635 [Setaria viridis]TKW32335.1 hypothetical protein SEVIR_2G163300v2 [Setaria viridis]
MDSSYHYNLSTACDINVTIFNNLTESYSKQLNDTSTLSTSFIMFVLTALFFNLNLFSGLSHVSAILDPKIRLGLTSALSLFLPVMSYLFSEAKNGSDVGPKSELPLRARFILIWMLLVELLRKKVEVIKMQGYSGTIERAGRVLWLGSLVFSNLQATGRKAMTGILWLLCATKLVQRISFTEVGKRSLAFGKNARVITSYMAQVLEKDQQGHRFRPEDRDELLKGCQYAVMEEDDLVVEAIPSGYRLRDDANVVATVGKIWGLLETDPLLDSLDRDQRLRMLCLSFSLFKLLRRRFERLPAMTPAETRNYREVILKALYDESTSAAEVMFQVTNDELNFLCEYYHSVVPVVLASPFFLLANYFLLPLVVFVMCLVVIVLCSNGDVPFAFRSIKDDDYFTFFGITQMTPCLRQFFKSPVVFFCTVDFSITSLLFLMFIYEEVWEFFVFLFSDWFLVSLLCKYATKPQWHNSRAFGRSIRCILFARSLMSRPGIRFHQFCVLKFCGLAMPAQLSVKVPILPTIPVPREVKHSVMEYLSKLHDRDGNHTSLTLSNGRLALAGHPELSQFCESDSVAEVILTWHIATSLLEVKHPPQGKNNVATSLSKYCAYLVAFHPELLPDNQDSAELVFKGTKAELYDLLGFWDYYLSSCVRTRHRKIMASSPAEAAAAATTVVQKGAALGRILERKAAHPGEGVWKVLANLWVELFVYIAPSSNEECVAGHENVLAKGGEFITVLWAMATHAGISRPADAPPVEVAIERIMGTTRDVSV